jgi:hypothetical protein
MNLVSGLEQAPGYFWMVPGASVTWAALAYGSLATLNTWPMYVVQRKLADRTALEDALLHNIDVIGEVRALDNAVSALNSTCGCCKMAALC